MYVQLKNRDNVRTYISRIIDELLFWELASFFKGFFGPKKGKSARSGNFKLKKKKKLYK